MPTAATPGGNPAHEDRGADLLPGHRAGVGEVRRGNIAQLAVRDQVAQNPPADPAALGRRVLQNLATGREKINAERREQAQFWRRVILDLALLDVQANRPAWGRAGRIARKLHGQLGERQVRKYLASLASRTESVG